MRRPWLFRGGAINTNLIPGAGILVDRRQVIGNLLGTAEDFYRGTLLLDRKAEL